MPKVAKSKRCWSADIADHAKCKFGMCQCPCHRQQAKPAMSIIEAAREELLTTLSDLIDRYDYETVRDVLWGLKPDVSGQFWCGDCRRYVDEVIHGCRRSVEET